MRKELTHAPLMIGQATCQSRRQVLFPLSARACDGANSSCRDSQPATSRASSIPTEWDACRHRRGPLGKPLTERASDPFNIGGMIGGM